MSMRRTRQRDAIREAFEKAGRPLSPSECREIAARAVPDLGIATVYRNIKRLAGEGWLQVVDLPGSASRYEVATRQHHHHFHCTACDGVFDVEACPGDMAALTPRGFRLTGHDIILYGLCDGCAAN